MLKLTREQAVVISAYTGYLICNFSEMHKEIEKRLGRPVWTHELGDLELFKEQIQSAFKADFVSMGNDETT